MSKHELIMAHTTCASADQAQKLAGRLVEERLVACASVGADVVSVYPWQGRIDTDREVAVVMKTTRRRFAALARRLRELHDYDVPELLAVPVIEYDTEYANWIIEWVHSEHV